MWRKEDAVYYSSRYIHVHFLISKQPEQTNRASVGKVTRLPISVAVPYRVLNRKYLRGTATAPVTLEHKIDEPHVSVVRLPVPCVLLMTVV